MEGFCVLLCVFSGKKITRSQTHWFSVLKAKGRGVSPEKKCIWAEASLVWQALLFFCNQKYADFWEEKEMLLSRGWSRKLMRRSTTEAIEQVIIERDMDAERAEGENAKLRIRYSCLMNSTSVFFIHINTKNSAKRREKGILLFPTRFSDIDCSFRSTKKDRK